MFSSAVAFTTAAPPLQSSSIYYAASPTSVLNIAGGSQTFATLPDTTVTMTGKSELHLTASTSPMTGSVINLNSSDAWLFFENIAPSVVSSTYLSQIQVSGAAAIAGTNVRIAQFAQGTLVIPHAPSYQPLQAFTGPNFNGTAQSFSQYTYYNTPSMLGTMYNNISSFKLKRGYMATIATKSDGTGLSKVYIAQDYDLDVSILPTEFDNAVHFLRVFPWRWVSKKGSGDVAPETLDASWHYNWSNSQSTSPLDWEYVPIQQQAYWPGAPTNATEQTQWLGFNEPNNPVEDSYSSLANGSVDAAIAWWPNMLKTGLRVGSPAVTDGGKSWLYEFMDKAIAKNLRVDFIAIHNYQAGNTAATLKSWLQDIWDRYHLPIWVTEFNNGANWTGGADPTYAQNATWFSSILDMMDTTSWIERYSVYSNVEAVRQMTYADGSLTPAGQVYHDNISPVGYVQEPLPTTNSQSLGTTRLPMDGDTLDDSGAGNNGQTFGAPTYVAGHSGQAIQLDGASSFVQLPETIAHADNFSFAGWVYWDGGAAWQRIFDFGTSTTNFLFLTPSNGTKFRFGIKNGGTEQIVETTALTAGQWTHVAVTLGSSTAKLYVNGALAATNSAVTIKPSDIDPTLNYLGKSQFTTDPLFKGRLDDVLITDTVLTASQIAALMNDTPPAFTSGTISLGPASRGVAFTGTLAGTATDADAGDTITYSKTSGPAWLQIAANGTLSGTPTFPYQAPQEFVVAVTDSRGNVNYAVLNITLAELYWRGDVNGTWTTNSAGNTNWSSDLNGTVDAGRIPDAATDVLLATSNAGNLSTVLGANLAVRSLRIKTPSGVTIGGTNSLTIGSDGLSMEADSGAATINMSGQVILAGSQVWTTSSGLVVTSVVSGAAGLTKNGSGSLTLTNDNTFTGPITVNEGTLQLGNGGATGSVLGDIFSNGDQLIVNRSTNLSLTGVISGATSLTKNGAGLLTLSGRNTFTGDVTVGAGVLQATANGALGTGTVTIGPGGNAITARLNLSGDSTYANAITVPMRNNASASIQNISGTNKLSGTISFAVGGTTAIFQSDAGLLTLGAITSGVSGSRVPTLGGSGNGLVSGEISDGLGVVGLIKSGTGTWTLGAVNTYTGDTTISAGTLALGGADRIADGSNLILNGGTFANNGFSEALGALSLSNSSILNLGSGSSTLNFSGVGTFTSAKTLTINNFSGGSHLFIGTSASLTAGQLAQINFNGIAATQLSTGEVVPVGQKIYYWKGDVGATWSSNSAGNTNWSTNAAGTIDAGALLDASTDAVFAATGASNMTSMVLGADATVKSLAITTASALAIGGANNLTIGSGGLGVISTAGANTISTSGQVILGAGQTWSNASTSALTVSSAISGTGALTLNGNFTFTGANLNTGGTTINSGTLRLGNGASMTGSIIDHGTLQVNRSTDLTMTNVISGTGVLTAQGAGILTLSSSNSYTGGTTIGLSAGAGIVRAAATGALGAGIVQLDSTGNGSTARLELIGGITLANDVFVPMRTNASVALQNISGNNQITGDILLVAGGNTAIFQSDAGTLTINTLSAASGSRSPTLTGAGNGVVSGAISNGAGTISLVKSGAGTWTLGGSNTYTGTTTINAGTLALSAADRIASASNMTLNGGIFATGGFNESLGTLALSDNSSIDLGAGVSTLSYSGAATFAAGKALSITNWTSGTDRIFVGNSASLTTTQLAQITFSGSAATQLPTGEVVPIASLPTIASAASSGANPLAGTATSLSVLGADDQGEAALKYTWTSTGPAPVALTANGTNAAKNPTAMFIKAGTYTMQVSAYDGTSTVNSSTIITVNSVLTSLAISPDTVSLKAGQTQQFAVTAYDQFGEVMATPAITWSVSGAGSINSSGLYTAGAGSSTITATSGSVSTNIVIGVSSSAPTLATPASAATSTVTGSAVALNVLGADDGGEAALIYNWALASGPSSVSFNANQSNAAKNTVATFHLAGTYVLRATISDGNGNSVSSNVSVTVAQTATSIKLTPTSAFVGTGTTKQFAVAAKDQFGAPITSPSATWSISAGGGTINSAGLFTAPAAAGKSTVRVQVGTLIATSAVSVFSWSPYNLTAKKMSASTVAVTFRDSTTIETGFDIQVGLRRADGTIRWSTIYTTGASAGTGGTVSYTFASSFTPGTWSFRARAKSGATASNWSNSAIVVI